MLDLRFRIILKRSPCSHGHPPTIYIHCIISSKQQVYNLFLMETGHILGRQKLFFVENYDFFSFAKKGTYKIKHKNII